MTRKNENDHQWIVCDLCGRFVSLDSIKRLPIKEEDRTFDLRICSACLSREGSGYMKYIKKTRKINPPTPGGVCNLSSVVGQVIRIAKTVRKTSDPATIRDVLVDALIGTLHQLQQLRKKAPSDLEKGKGGATKESCSRTIAYVAQVLNAVLDSKVRIDEILKRIEELEKQVEENER